MLPRQGFGTNSRVFKRVRKPRFPIIGRQLIEVIKKARSEHPCLLVSGLWLQEGVKFIALSKEIRLPSLHFKVTTHLSSVHASNVRTPVGYRQRDFSRRNDPGGVSSQEHIRCRQDGHIPQDSSDTGRYTSKAKLITEERRVNTASPRCSAPLGTKEGKWFFL